MTELTTRWLRMRRYSEAQIRKIHKLENDGWKSWKATMDSGGLPEVSAQNAAFALMAILDSNLGPYWPKATSNEHRQFQVERFERRAWGMAHRIVNDPSKTEMEALHEADLIVYQARIQFDHKEAAGSVSRNPEMERLRAHKPTGKDAAAGPDEELSFF